MIYFAQMDCSNGFIKIGVAIDLRQRIDKLQSASPYQINVVRVLPGGITEERKLHRRFSASHVKREWFRPDADLLTYIEANERSCLGLDPPREQGSPHRGSVFLRLAVDNLSKEQARRQAAKVRRTRILERQNRNRFAEPKGTSSNG